MNGIELENKALQIQIDLNELREEKINALTTLLEIERKDNLFQSIHNQDLKFRIQELEEQLSRNAVPSCKWEFSYYRPISKSAEYVLRCAGLKRVKIVPGSVPGYCQDCGGKIELIRKG